MTLLRACADHAVDLRPGVGPTARPDATEGATPSGTILRLWRAFAPLAAEQRRWALRPGVVEATRAGDPFHASGEVAVVVSGCLVTDGAGAELAADILGPGEVVASGAARAVRGHWLADGELYRVALGSWTSSAGEAGLMHLLAALDRRRAVLERRIGCSIHHLATPRVADLLLSICDMGASTDIRLSQEKLGGLLGLRRTTVNASCRSLQSMGAVRVSRGRLRVLARAKLAGAACGCRQTDGSE